MDPRSSFCRVPVTVFVVAVASLFIGIVVSASAPSRFPHHVAPNHRESTTVIDSASVPFDITPKSTCPCSNVSLCAPLTSPPATREVFAFSVDGTNWDSYDWDVVTTIGIVFDADVKLVCQAHSHNVRVVLVTDVSTDILSNPTERVKWVLTNADTVRDKYLDGINVDYESAVALDSESSKGLTSLMNTTFNVFKQYFPHSQVTFDVAWSPACIDNRCYEYAELAKYTDFLFVMAYDMRSQIFGPCVAGANSPVNAMADGLKAFTSLGIPSSRLVLGLPWYGYDYPCTSLTPDHSPACGIDLVPFRGVPCSDAAGHQRSFADIWAQVNASSSSSASSTPISSITESGLDYDSATYRFMYTTTTVGADGSSSSSSSSWHSVWYDNVSSLAYKTALVRTLALRGVGMWNADQLDYKSTDAYVRQMNREMWKLLGDA